MSGSEHLRRLRWLVFHAWNIPPLFGLGFILLIGVLQPSQMLGILSTPLEPAYILGWLAFALWFLPRQIRPLADWLDSKPGSSPESAQRAVRRFPLVFWGTFLIYLAIAPASVIIAAEIYTDFVATPYDWFRIELVALIVSIIVGLPIFFLIFNLFGQALGALKLSRPIVGIRTRVFLIGALMPLLIDTMLVQYYWTRTGHFTFETFGVWLLLELLAIGGSLIFARSFGQSLEPLQELIGAAHPLPEGRIAALRSCSTDEIGVITADYRQLLEEQRLQWQILELNNRLLRSAGGNFGTAAVFQQVVELCRQAVDAEQAFILLFDPVANELVGVIHSGVEFCAEGHYRIRLDEASIAAWAFNQRQTVSVADTRNDLRVSQRMCQQFNVRAALVAPLRLDEEVIGVIMAVTHAGPRNYGTRDIALIEGLAREAAYALHSQQLREESSRAEAKRREYQEESRRWEERFSKVFLASPIPIFISRLANGMYLDVNQASERMFGWSREDTIGYSSVDLGVWADPQARQRWITALKAERRSENHEAVFRARSGELRMVLLSAEIIELEGEECILGLVFDNTARKRDEEQLRIAAAAFESQQAMMVTDADAMILRVNRAFTEITGYSAAEAVGQTPQLLQSGRHDANFYRAMWATVNRTGGWQGEVWDRRKNGEEYPKWLTISAVKDEAGTVTHYVGTHSDITERKQAEQRINELAFFDQLTGLPNRTLLLDRLKQTMAASSRSGSYAALLFIDLDNFKTLNDTLGHDMGDLLLKQVAQRLTACVRDGDTVARLGGDEFVVLLAGFGVGEADAATGVETVTEKILAALGQSYLLGQVPHRSTASIGVALFKGDLATSDELMKQADLAMYKSKAAGRNMIRFFDPALEVAVKERAALEADLRRAIDEKQLLLHYQAQIVGEGRVTGAEALVRWQRPEHGMVSPDKFIPLAEDTGLILPLGHWVLETACAQLAEWATRPKMAGMTMAVNVSAHQFRQPDFVDQVLAVLENTGANPQRLKLELTESLLVSDVEEIIDKMFALKAKGVGFSLDDFGTGYSSLSYLKRLPLDQLKIDQSFVRDILVDPNDAAIAKTIIALAASLGLGVLAEGVETEAQRDFLASSGCHAYQGYFFSRPLSLERFEEYLLPSVVQSDTAPPAPSPH